MNIIHLGDNLEFMQTLPSESIDLIYCDILYGTGRDFGTYKDIGKGRKEVNKFYIPRITEMHRLLKKTGSIYLQMDTRICHYVRLIMEKVFGVRNFRNQIVWKRRNNPTQCPAKVFHGNHDIILFFTKSKDYYFNQQYKPLTKESVGCYNKKDSKGNFCFNRLIGRGYNKVITLTFDGKEYTGAYKWSQKMLDKRKNDVVVNSKGDLCCKKYLHESKGAVASDLWDTLTYENSNGQVEKKYNTQKSLPLMARIINSSSKEGDVCADFFCGSGSFGVAAKKLNRNFILCDIGEEAITETTKRINQESNKLF